MITMRKYINKKYITILLIVIITTILSGNYFTCPRYLIPIGLDSFNSSLIWYKYFKFNSTVIHYSGFLGEANFGFIVYLLTPILRPITTPREIYRIIIVVEKISERTYNPLVKGFAINIEAVILFDYCNDTDIHIYADAVFDFERSLYNLSQSVYSIYPLRNYLPKTLYARINYVVHAIINPYAEIWYSTYKYITTGFHIKVYSGSLIIPITIKPE